MSGLDGLRQRLGALVQQRGTETAATESQAWTTRIAGLRDAQRVRESMRRSAERALPGEDVAQGVRLVRTIEPWTHGLEHGLPGSHPELCPGQSRHARGISEPPPVGLRGCGVNLDSPSWEAPGMRNGPLLFLDTETTGLSGGTGTLVFLLGLARFQGDGLLVEQWLLTRPSDEARWLDEIARSLPQDAHLVSFNG